MRRYGSACYCVEASGELATELMSDSSGKMRVVRAAVSGENGFGEFCVSTDITGSSLGRVAGGKQLRSEMVPLRTIESIAQELGLDRIDLMKVDIEGAEVYALEVIPECLLQRIDQIAIEFHDVHGVISTRDVTATKRRLERLGFDGIKFSLNNTNWVFVRRDRIGVGWLEWWYVKVIVRWIRGTFRKLRLSGN